MNVEDVSWIREGAQKGWILLSGNKNMRYVPLELKAIQESQARVFVLAQGDWPGPRQVAAFVNNLERIIKAAQTPGPYIQKVYDNHLEPWWHP